MVLVFGWVQAQAAEPSPLRLKIDLHNYENFAEAEIFEECFVECQKNGIPVVPEVVHSGGRNASVHAAWLDSMLKKYPAIAGIAFCCNGPGQLDTNMMREYLDVCGENGMYFFFNVGNKSCTLPEDLDKMLAEGLIGRIAYFRASRMKGPEIERERANGCTVFGGNEPGRASADYWESLRKTIGAPSAGTPAGRPRAVVRGAKQITFPDDGDCISPSHWDGDTMYIFGSNAGHRVSRASGPDLFNLQRPPVWTKYDNAVMPYHGGRGRWIEATYKDADGKLYGWYHMELPRGKYHDHIEQGKIVACPGADTNKIITVCLTGAVVSTNNGVNWHDLGIVLKVPDDSLCCDTPNRFWAGGNGDCSVILDQQKKYFYFFISTYNKYIKEQGVSVARMAYDDRTNPVGKVFKWHKGNWEEPGLGGRVTPIFPAKSSWHVPKPDVFWGPSVHWNGYLKQYVVLLNRTLDRSWAPEGIYVTFNPDLSNPGQWTEPAKILDASELPGHGWYPQVVGTNVLARETDKLAGKVARLFVFNTSKWEIEFSFDGNSTAASGDTKPSASSVNPGGVLRPEIDGPWWTVAHSPDLGAMSSPDQQPVDFAVWQAADGSWQICSCIRGTKCGGRTRLLYRWEGQRLTDPDWRPIGIAMQSEPKYGEMAGGLQAPHVVKIGEKYVMAYGDSEHICMAESRDGKQFERIVQPNGKTGLFAEGTGNRTRDPMLIRIADRWHCYYTAYPNNEGWDFCRTSADLVRWSDSVKVAFGGQAGTGPLSAECPFVVPIGDRFYLFRTQRYGQNALTTVYHSTDSMDFGVNNDCEHLVGTLPVAAPEIVLHKGQYYIAALRSDLKGIQITRLKWVPMKQDAASEVKPVAGQSGLKLPTVRVAGVVLKWRRADKEANYRRAEPLIREAAAQGAQIVCTTECFLDGYAIADKSITLEQYRALGEPIPQGPYFRRLRALARELNIYLVTGLQEALGEACFNTAAIIGPDGELVGKYHKQQLEHEAVGNATVMDRSLTSVPRPSLIIFLQEAWVRANIALLEPEPVERSGTVAVQHFTQWHTWIDGLTGGAGGIFSKTGGMEHFSNVHAAGGNLVFIDGHVEYRKYRKLQSGDFGLIDPNTRQSDPWEPSETQSRKLYIAAF
jgi:prepilin-type processing-associated H-X9-DG protein